MEGNEKKTLKISNLLLHLLLPDFPLIICTHHKFFLAENEVAGLEICGSYQNPEQCIGNVKRENNAFCCNFASPILEEEI